MPHGRTRIYYMAANNQFKINQLAKDMGAPTLANMILLGAIVKETGCVSEEHLEEGLRHAVPARHADLIDLNLKAIEIGKNYTQD